MRKILALLLALCMILAAIPALAAEDASGEWYMVMFSLTVGNFTLNADGSCVLQIFAMDEDVNVDGTWTQEEDKVMISVNGNTIPLTNNGDSLQFDAEAIAALGLEDSSMDAMGVDYSTFVKITREPGTATFAEFNAYQADGTLPEGKTEEDMQAIQAEMMMMFLSVMASGDADPSGETGTTEEGPAPELTVVEDNFYVREGYGEQEGVYIVKLQNDNENPVYLSGGTLTLLDVEENEVGKADYLYTSGSRYLEPGEVTFMLLVASVNEGATVDHYDAHIDTEEISYHNPDTTIAVDASELRVEDGYFSKYYYCAATITNTTEEPQAHISTVIAVRDSEGKLMGLANAGLYQNELAAGSTIILVDSLDSRVSEYCENNGLTLDQVEAVAWIDTY